MALRIAPATLEGWYALHQVLETDWHGLAALPEAERVQAAREIASVFGELAAPEEGWTVCARLIGGRADWLVTHLRPTLEELADIQLRLRSGPAGRYLHVSDDFLSVTEAGMYQATAEVADEALPGSEEFAARLEERLAGERDTRYVQARLFPQPPEGMSYLSFYPMSKRRDPGANWYTLGLGERSALMREHGSTGRRFAGRILQMITGAIGLDDWEWGVTLFARSPLDLKQVVTEMRYDEASAVYGEFGVFYTAIRFEPDAWASLLSSDD
jgi:hydrogen peroxide-dependent heme synthase